MPRLPAAELINRLENGEIIVTDGAMGTELIRRGALASETLNCNRMYPDWVKAVHHEYIEAGARLLYSNTFAPPKSREEYTDVLAGWQILCDVCRESEQGVWAALSLYPATILSSPNLLDELIRLEEVPDLIVIETCTSLTEAKAAVDCLAVWTNAKIFVTAVVDDFLMMPDQTFIMTWAEHWESVVRVSSYGANCGDKPMNAVMARHEISNMLLHSPKPLLIRPSAGMPREGGTYSSNANSWAGTISQWMRDFHGIVGGCCGTTPEHIRALANELEKIRQEPKQEIFDFGRNG